MTEQSELNLGMSGPERHKECTITDPVADPLISPRHSLPGFAITGGLQTASLGLLWLEHS